MDKHYRYRALVTACVFFLLALIKGASADIGWRTYADPVLGYSLLYPAALFDGTPVREHGGITLTSSSGARLYVFGGRNPPGRSAEDVAAQLAATEDVDQVTYRRLTRDWLVLSGYLTDAPSDLPGGIFYERVAFSPDRTAFAGFRLVYAPAERALFDPIIATIGRSLRQPGSQRIASSGAGSPPQAEAASLLAHREWCRQKYSTYDPATDSFLRYDGKHVPCVIRAD
jgi:hypothetical protein